METPVTSLTTKSSLPSPLTSAAVTQSGLTRLKIPYSCCGVSVPMELLVKIIRMPEALLTTAMSGWPSPLKSPTATATGFEVPPGGDVMKSFCTTGGPKITADALGGSAEIRRPARTARTPREAVYRNRVERDIGLLTGFNFSGLARKPMRGRDRPVSHDDATHGDATPGHG